MPETPSAADARYRLDPVRTAADWAFYHAIRRDALFARLVPEHVYDEDDPDETAPGHLPHLLRFDGEPIGTIRIDLVGTDRAGLRLIAIRDDRQHRGHGKALLRLAEATARTYGRTEIVINAHPSALAFYLAIGYATGPWPDERPLNPALVRVAKSLPS